MTLRRIATWAAALALPLTLFVGQPTAAEAAGLCGENYHSVGRGPVQLTGSGGQSHGWTDVQYNPGQRRWCFLVKARESISFVWIQGKYRASTEWDVKSGRSRSWKAVYLNSNGGKCVDAWARIVQIEGETVARLAGRCRA
ncbi:hypothetical protein GCM10029976_093330 [Kribbella albertanoniae]|uniref:Uncharacterized protein n=1 Tax=Kribbella albertanoniae TaxID=1266829 RepID=A0A4R4Q2M4_9ACTN|nr:hypothetical protein [Kribbella albertanoniae]TDC29043.1 hypothetical protein E1261_16735 [Kribbella albertanoniae]